ncbi:MAG: hypothetical protein LBQ31_05190 [Bacteroidales bacterium]|jgi:phosphate-selective porin OprO/OprP|nr:hypothetical protein [Bacteroidales bacterium]
MRSLFIFIAASICCFAAFAQSDDSDPHLLSLRGSSISKQIEVTGKSRWAIHDSILESKAKSNVLRWTIGASFMVSAGYFNSSPKILQSGATISDARIRTSFAYGDYYFFYDANFGNGRFSQMDAYFKYSHKEQRYSGTHSIKAGYVSNIASMGYNTSMFNLHFITRAAPVQAFSSGRHLGALYKYVNKYVLFEQGVFAESPYNNYNGIVLSGRWLYKPINREDITLHFGISARYRKRVRMDTSFMSASSLETDIDGNDIFLSRHSPNASNIGEGTFEFALRTNRFFARGEGIFRRVGNDLLGGAYIEAGFCIFGRPYTYNERPGAIGGLRGHHTLEVVARYSQTRLDNTVHIATLGLNYDVNDYIVFMGAYSLTVDKGLNVQDGLVHSAQIKMLLSF